MGISLVVAAVFLARSRQFNLPPMPQCYKCHTREGEEGASTSDSRPLRQIVHMPSKKHKDDSNHQSGIYL